MTFGQVAGTQMACLNPSGAEGPALPSSGLLGTSWRLVTFQSSDDSTLTPDDRTKYTIEFAANGRLHARIDCNRGRGTWKSSGASQLQFGPAGSDVRVRTRKEG